MKKGLATLRDKELSDDLTKILTKHQNWIIQILKEQFFAEFENVDYINIKNINDFFDSRLKKLML
jgi:hypothetical protein